MTPGEEDTWAFEEEDDDVESVGDGEEEVEAEAALVPGEVDVARDGEGAEEDLSCVTEEGEGEETGAGLDASEFALGIEGVDWEGMGLDWSELDREDATGVICLACWNARRW